MGVSCKSCPRVMYSRVMTIFLISAFIKIGLTPMNIVYYYVVKNGRHLSTIFSDDLECLQRAQKVLIGVINSMTESSLGFLTTNGFISPIKQMVTSSDLTARMASITNWLLKETAKRSPLNWKVEIFSRADPLVSLLAETSTSSSCIANLTTGSLSPERTRTRSMALKSSWELASRK